MPKLAKAANDARAMAAALEKVGFLATDATDVSRPEMNRTIASIHSKVEPGDDA